MEIKKIFITFCKISAYGLASILIIWIWAISLIIWGTSEIKECSRLSTNLLFVYRDIPQRHTDTFQESIRRKIPWLYPWNFECLDGHYGKDRSTVYYEGVPLIWVDIKTFQPILNWGATGYAKDKKNIYYESSRTEADLESFSFIGWGVMTGYFYQDKNYVYCKWKKVEWVDIATFTIDKGQDKAKDKNREYTCSLIFT